MLSHVIIIKECNCQNSIYSLRIYKEKVDTTAEFDSLPPYIGSGIIRITGNTAFVFATTVDNLAGKLHNAHVSDFIAKLKELGCDSMEWERHKQGKVKIVKYNF